MLSVLWLHTSRVARPAVLPPKPVLWSVFGALIVLALVRPATMADAANPLRIAAAVPADWFFAFWLPISRSFSGSSAFVGAVLTFAGLLAVPLVTRRRGSAAPLPSVVDENICTGCRQCFVDCPFDAITMLRRDDGRADEVGHVNPDLCVSCGICAGSCAPMGVGPAGRTGRDQLTHVRQFLARPGRRDDEVVAICCERGASRFGPLLERDGAAVYPVDCAGSLHTSVIELMVRSGCAGVLVLACPPRDCWNREGPRWLHERVYHDREAELQARVDRRRVHVAFANASEPHAARAALRNFRAQLSTVHKAEAEQSVAIAMECDPVPAGEPE